MGVHGRVVRTRNVAILSYERAGGVYSPKKTIAAATVLFLEAIFVWHRREIRSLADITLTKTIFMFAVTLLSTLTAGLTNQLLLNSLQMKTKFWEMVLLQNATCSLNYTPMKLGTYIEPIT